MSSFLLNWATLITVWTKTKHLKLFSTPVVAAVLKSNLLQPYRTPNVSAASKHLEQSPPVNFQLMSMSAPYWTLCKNNIRLLWAHGMSDDWIQEVFLTTVLDKLVSSPAWSGFCSVSDVNKANDTDLGLIIITVNLYSAFFCKRTPNALRVLA